MCVSACGFSHNSHNNCFSVQFPEISLIERKNKNLILCCEAENVENNPNKVSNLYENVTKLRDKNFSD